MVDFRKQLLKEAKKNEAKETKLIKEIKEVKASTTVNTADTLVIEHKLNKMFLTMQDHREETRAGLHGSAIIQPDSSFCYRAQLLSLFYEQTQGHELPVGLLKIFAAGNSIHEKWQTMFEKCDVCVKNEARSFSEKYDMYFTPDSILRINDKLYVCEIKSMNTFSFKKATSHPSGEKQCLLYMHLLGIEDGFVLAEDKNDQNIKIFPVKYDYEKVLPYIDRLNEIQEMKKDFVENKTVPERRCKSSETKQALGCNMRECCFSIGKGRVKLKY